MKLEVYQVNQKVDWGLNRKYSNSNQKFKISKKNTLSRKGNELFDRPKFKKSSKKFTYYDKYQKDKYNIS